VESVATSLAVGGCRPGPAVLGRQVEPEELEDAVGAGRGEGREHGIILIKNGKLMAFTS